MLAVAVAALSLAACSPADSDAPEDAREVVVYTSVDQVYAQEVLNAWSERTGIDVLPLFDTEAGKTTGLYNRLLAEKDRPRADVFWNGEIIRTLQLVDEGLADDISHLVPDDLPEQWTDPEGQWAAFSLRARVFVYNTKLVDDPTALPQSLEDAAKPAWKGKFVMANPQFGTTCSHMAALRVKLGDEAFVRLLRDLKANDMRLVEGNSVVRDVVAAGEMPVGLTDTDDVYAGIAEGLPIDFIVPEQGPGGIGTFGTPNTVMKLAGGPNPEAAEALTAYLLSAEFERRMAFSRARQVPVRSDVERPEELEPFVGVKYMDVDFEKVAAGMPETVRLLEDVLLTEGGGV
jgi:iron(III) transport system substrate-binding protein